LFAHDRCTPASSTTKTGRHDIAEILLKVALKHQNQIKSKYIPVYDLIKKIRICGVMDRVLALSTIVLRARIIQKSMKLVFIASPLSMQN
jgi:hypothetical protein